ncbi:LPXTG-motif cell wall anchor domain-containing protein/conserved repeat domain-containing protein [Sanguibacter gelidistatuariae]|uniref:LPXTG-motif cell wall anchor domain-containing protein/conserved repeat domain-containing protein n=1 Tax=Sanguibacter gelidistatuariae TaxID=1814289 RepID=A0A1G6H6X7_9MICO|nr:SdrD B-like domain-containing protein [Sanguibacter gelidistatuariae]SDB90012.1 LPXTG-motif cell wall anchor domain-containing protein/conserved repeat domain-containing protein [Sanguibacter gelidistatuariae]
MPSPSMPIDRPDRSARRRRSFSVLTALSMLLALVFAGLVPATAYAANAAKLTIDKTSTTTRIKPGDSMTWKVEVSCSSLDIMCEDVIVQDTVPAPLVYVSHTITNLKNPAVVTVADNGLTVALKETDPRFPGKVGLPAGQEITITITAKMPESTNVSWNGVDVTNTAKISSTHETEEESSQTVVPDITETPGVEVGKSWRSPSQTAGSPDTNTVTLTLRNTSNIAATSLSVTDPKADTPNPFDAVALTALGAVVFPQGADRVSVTVTTPSGPVTSGPSATASLPAGITLSEVTGISFEFTSSTGATLTADGTQGSVEVLVTQRLPIDPSVTKVDNTATATVVTKAGEAMKDASASFTIQPLKVSVAAGKSFSPSTITAGSTSIVRLTATNTSNQPLSSMTITEPSATGANPFGADKLTFVNFGATASASGASTTTWPAGATAATVTFKYSDAGPAATAVQVAPGDSWPVPAIGRPVSGFTVTYTGDIAVGAKAEVPFLVSTSPGTTTPGTTIAQTTIPNEVQVDGVAAGTSAAPAKVTATLTVRERKVTTSVSKTLSPSVITGVVGQELLATLSAAVNESTVPVHTLVLEDQANTPEGSNLWGPFVATSVARVEVPAGATLRIEKTDGPIGSGTEITTVPGPMTVYDNALPTGLDGVRFVLTTTDPAGFKNGQTLTAKILLTRVTAGTEDGTITNVATSQGFGTLDTIGEVVQDDDTITTGPGTTATDIRSVEATKTISDYLVIPADGAPAPTTMMTFSVKNTSGIRVPSLQLVDPAPSTDPATSSFEFVDIQKISAISIPVGYDPTTTSVVVHGAAGALFTFTGATAVTQALALTSSQLANATGISVTSGGRLIENSVLEVKILTSLRTHTRTAGTPITSTTDITNVVLGTIVAGPGDEDSDTTTIYPADKQPLAMSVAKRLDPSTGTLRSADPDRVVNVHLTGTVDEGRPTTLTITDDTTTFWNAFTFAKVTAVRGGSNSATRGHLEFLVGSDWFPGAPFTIPTGAGSVPPEAAALPTGVSPETVVGIRLVAATTDGSTLPGGVSDSSTTGYHLKFAVSPRLELRSGGEVSTTASATANAGETTPGTVTNVVSGSLVATGRTVDAAPKTATYTVTPGTIGAEVSKTSSTSASQPGARIDFTLTVKNSGTTVMTNPVFTDNLPHDVAGAQITYDPIHYESATFAATPATASITTDPSKVTVETSPDGQAITISFPEGTVLLPGETYSVTLPMRIRAGVAGGTSVTNEFHFTADAGVSFTDTVTVAVLAGESYLRIKDVQEDVPDGGTATGVIKTNPLDPTDCVNDGGFFRVPCLVLTQPGGTETWRLRVSNTGNLPATTLTIVDVFPYAGDFGTSKALSSISRGSTWAPTYVGDLDLSQVPAGTTTTTEYLVGDQTCVFTGVPKSADPFGPGCEASVWTTVLPADLTTVKGLKLTFDFADALQPGEGIQATFRTRSGTSLPPEAPELNAPAWNSMVVFVTTDHNGVLEYGTLEPNKAGIAFTQKYAVGDRVWIDADKDGLQGPDEEGLAGVDVALYRVNGDGSSTLVSTTQTDAAGDYVFDLLPAGDYFVEFTLTPEQKERYTFTTRHAVSADPEVDSAVYDSDAGPDGRSQVFTLGAASADLPHMVAGTDYSKRALRAGFIDPTLDAGVVLRPEEEKPVVTPDPKPTPTPTPAPTLPNTGGGTAVPPPAVTPSGTPTLPLTGSDVAGIIALGAALLAGGAALVVLTRRRRSMR